MIENTAWFSTYSAILIGLCRLIAILKLKIKLSLVLKDLVLAFINCCLPWFFCSYGSILEILRGSEDLMLMEKVQGCTIDWSRGALSSS